MLKNEKLLLRSFFLYVIFQYKTYFKTTIKNMIRLKISQIIAYTGLLILFSGLVQASENEKAAEYLHNYGIAYCLSNSDIYAYEAGIAQGGYFQLGHHSVEAQDHIQRYIDQQLEGELDGYKNSNIKAYLMRCLEISYSKDYQEQVKRALELDSLD